MRCHSYTLKFPFVSRNCKLSEPSELSRDKAIAKRLWATSEVWTKLKDLNEVLPPKTSTSKS